MNACIYEIIRRGGCWLPTLLGALAFVGTVRADVKVVATVSATGLLAPPPSKLSQGPKPPHFPQKATTYYKGSRTRLEVAGGPVMITDTASSEGYWLDPSRKTYFMLPPRPNGFRQRFGGGPPMDGRMSLKATGKTRIIAGLPAHGYTILSAFRPRRDGPPRDGGGFGGPGGPPPGARPGPPPPTPQISGEIWLSDTVALPGSGSAAAGSLALRGGPEGKFLADALARMKRLPLGGRVSMTHAGPPPWDRGGQAAPASQKTVTTMTVLSVSQAALSDALFRLPPGYTEVNPLPRRERIGPPPGGGRFGGPPPGGPIGPPPPPGGEWR